MTNIIDIKKLPVREGKTSDTYLTLSQEGDLTRTTIVIPEGGNTDNVDLTDYYTKSEVDNLISNLEIPEGGTTGGAGKGLVQGAYTNYYQDSAMVQLLAHNQIGRDTVEEAYNNNRVLYVGVTDNPSGYPSTKKYIPVTIEAHYNADARVTGYTVWGWYSKTQTITWEIDDTVNSVWGTIE